MEIPASCVCLRAKMWGVWSSNGNEPQTVLLLLLTWSPPSASIRLYLLLDGDNKTVSLPGIYLIYGLHYWIPVPVWQRRVEERSEVAVRSSLWSAGSHCQSNIGRPTRYRNYMEVGREEILRWRQWGGRNFSKKYIFFHLIIVEQMSDVRCQI